MACGAGRALRRHALARRLQQRELMSSTAYGLSTNNQLGAMFMKTAVAMQSTLRLSVAACALALAPLIALAQTAPAPEQAPPATPAPQRPAGGGIGYESTFPAIASGKWTGKRLPDGQPDIAGDWSNTIANHNNFTDPQGGIPGDPTTRNRTLGPREERAPSRVSDPADGQLPYQEWSRAKQQEFAVGFFNALKPEYIEPLARCAPAGIPKSLYWHGYEIRQYPGYVVFLFGSGWRIIYLDDKSHHLPDNIKLWNGDSRGHWEGNTLVVDVSNLNSKARLGRTGDFTSENVHIEERYIFSTDNKRYNYVATFTDPSVFTRPFTVTIPARRWTLDDPKNGWHFPVVAANNPGKAPIGDHFERICVENNGGFGQVAAAPKN